MKHFHCLGQLKRHRAPDARLHSPPLQGEREREREEDGRAFILRLHLSIRAYPSRLLCVLDLRRSAGAATFHSASEGGRPAAAATFRASCCKGTLRRGSSIFPSLSISLYLSLSLSISLYLSTLNLQTDPFLLLLPSSVSSFTVDQREAAERPAASSHVVWSLASRRARLCTAASCAWRRGTRGRGALATLTHYKGELCHFMSGFGTQKESV